MHKLFIFIFSCVLLTNCNETNEDNKHKSIVEDSTSSSDYNIFIENNDRLNQYYDSKIDGIVDLLYKEPPGKLISILEKKYSFKNEKYLKINKINEIYIHGYNSALLLVDLKISNSNCKYYNNNRLFIFKKDGQLILTTTTNNYFIKKLLPDSSNCLVSISKNCKGLGNHNAFIYKDEKLINIIINMSEKDLYTFDMNPNNGIYKDHSLSLNNQVDINNDGYKDILFEGERLIFNNTDSSMDSSLAKSTKLTYQFIYYPAKQLFIMN